MNLLTRFTVDMSALERAFSRGRTLAVNYAQTTQQQFGAASRSVQVFGTRLGEAQQKAEKFRAGMMGIAYSVGGLGAAFSAASALMIRESIKQESAFAGIRKTVDETEKGFAQLHANLREMSNRRPVDFSDLSKIGELAGQLGVRGVDNLTKFIDVISRMGVATMLTTEAAATGFARIANVMQEPITNVDRMGSSIVDLGNKFATTEPEIVTFAERIAGAGKIAKLTTADVLAIGAAMSSVGIEAEAGGTAVNKMLIAITQAVGQGGEKLAQFARLSGQTEEEFQKLFNTKPVEAFTKVVEGLGKAGQGAFSFIDEIVGGEARFTRAFLSLANAQDLLRRAVDTSNTAWRENRALLEESEKRFKTAESSIVTMWNSIKNLGASMTDSLLPVLSATARSMSSVAEAFQKLPDPIKTVIAVLGIGLAGSLTLTGGLALFLTMVPMVSAGFTIIGASALLLAGKIGLIVAGLAAIGIAVHHLNSVATTEEGMRAQQKKVRDRLNEMRIHTPGDTGGIAAKQRELDAITKAIDSQTMLQLQEADQQAALDRFKLGKPPGDDAPFGTVSKDQASDYMKLVRERAYGAMSPADAELARFKDTLLDRAKDMGPLREAAEAMIPALMAQKRAVADLDAQWRESTLAHDTLKTKFQDLEAVGLLADGDKNPLSFYNLLVQDTVESMAGATDSATRLTDAFFGFDKPLTLLSSPEGPMAAMSDRGLEFKNTVTELEEKLGLMQTRLRQTSAEAQRDALAIEKFGIAYGDLSPTLQALIDQYVRLDEKRRNLDKTTSLLAQTESQYNEIVRQGLDHLISQQDLQRANEMREYEAALQSVINVTEFLTEAEERQATMRNRLLQATAKANGDVWGFIIAKMEEAAGIGVSMWHTIADAAVSAVDFMRDTLSNVFFEWFNGASIKMRDLWRSVWQSMTRTIANFLADQAVKELFGLFIGLIGGLFGGGGGGLFGGGAATAAAASASGGGGVFSTGNLLQTGITALGQGQNLLSYFGGNTTTSGISSFLTGPTAMALGPLLGAALGGFGAIGGNSGLAGTGGGIQAGYSTLNLLQSLYGVYQGAGGAVTGFGGIADVGKLLFSLYSAGVPGASLGAVGGAIGGATGLEGAVSYVPSAGFGNFNMSSLFTGTNIASGLGALGGIITLIGAQTGNYKLSQAGQLLSVGSLGVTAGTGIAAAAAGGGAAAAGGAAAGGTAAIAGTAAAAAPYLAAAIIAALSIYDTVESTGAAYHRQPYGKQIGTQVGLGLSPTTLLSGGLTFLIPEEYRQWVDPIAGYIGGLVGSLFGGRNVPHRVREARELRDVVGGVNDFTSNIASRSNVRSLYDSLVANASGYVGGTSAQATNISLTKSFSQLGITESDIIRASGGGAHGFFPFGKPNQFYDVLTPEAAMRVMLQHPDAFKASVQAGVHPSMLTGPDAAVTNTLTAKLESLAEIQSQINKALNDLFRDVVGPAPANLEDFAETAADRFKEQLQMFRETSEMEIKRQRLALTKITDPAELIEQIGVVQQALSDRYEGEIDLIRQFTSELEALGQAWLGVIDSVSAQIDALTMSNMSPPDTMAQYNLARTRFTEALAAFRLDKTPETAAKLQQLVDPLLGKAAEIWTRPSLEYKAIYDEALAALNEVKVIAEAQSFDVNAVLERALGEGNTIASTTAANTTAMRTLMEDLQADARHMVGLLGFGPLQEMSASLQQLLAGPAPDPAAPIQVQLTEGQQLVNSMLTLNSSVLALNSTMGGSAPAPGQVINSPWGSYTIPDSENPFANVGYGAGATGIPFISRDGMYLLHREEAVLDRTEASQWRSGSGGSGGVNIVFEPGSVIVHGTDDEAAEAFIQQMLARMEHMLRYGKVGAIVKERNR